MTNADAPTPFHVPFDGLAAIVAGLSGLVALISYAALKPQAVSCGSGDYGEAAFHHATSVAGPFWVISVIALVVTAIAAIGCRRTGSGKAGAAVGALAAAVVVLVGGVVAAIPPCAFY
jgi:hypothetical protein